MLGRVGMALGNASIATDAYATAYRLDPKTAMLHWDTLKC